ncbi:hypothetical protein ACFSUI_23960 [Ralstonia solanacearum]
MDTSVSLAFGSKRFGRLSVPRLRGALPAGARGVSLDALAVEGEGD